MPKISRNAGFIINNKDERYIAIFDYDYDTIIHMTTNKIVVEIRAGAGGDEASIFAGDLARMYQRYAARRGCSFSILDSSENSQGYKSLTAEEKAKVAMRRQA